ncbi:MAG: hypothetical protein H6741_31775 [Alphaproteobacteria bacterium]|nr:hypothetical protein [Alphaproteobacteria bacterium]
MLGQGLEAFNKNVTPLDIAAKPVHNFGYGTNAGSTRGILDRDGPDKGSAGVGAGTDVALGASGMVAGGLGLWSDWATLKDSTNSAGKRAGAVYSGVTNLNGALAGGLTLGWGAMNAHQSIHAHDLVQPGGSQALADTANHFKRAGETMGAVAGGLGFIKEGWDYGKAVADTSLAGESGFTQAKRVGHLAVQGLKLGRSGYDAGVGAWKAGNAFKEHGLQAVTQSVGEGAKHTGEILGTVGAGLGIGVGVAEMGVGAIKVGKGIWRQRQLHGIKGAEGMTDDDEQIRQHLKGKQTAAMKSGGIVAAQGALGVVGGSLSATGFGAVPGAVIGGALGAFNVGRVVRNKFKQVRRDRKDRALVLKEAYGGDFGAALDDTNERLHDKKTDLLVTENKARRKELKKEIQALRYDRDAVRKISSAEEATGRLSGLQRWWAGNNTNEEKSTRQTHKKKAWMAERLLETAGDKTGETMLSTAGVDAKNLQKIEKVARKKWDKWEEAGDAKRGEYEGDVEAYVHAEKLRRIMKKL